MPTNSFQAFPIKNLGNPGGCPVTEKLTGIYTNLLVELNRKTTDGAFLPEVGSVIRKLADYQAVARI